MSFEQLMEHASEIRYLATKHAIEHNELDPEYARNGVDGYYEQLIEPLFKPFSDVPDPAEYQPMINDLDTAMRGISNGLTNDTVDKIPYLANPTLAKITTAGGYLAEWTGEAARTFKAKFIDPFPSFTTNQFILTLILKAALEAHQAMWASARKDIDGIAHATIDMFDNKCCDKNTWNVSFTVLSSIGAVGAAILTVATDGAAAPLALQVIGAAAQVGATLPPDSLSEPPKGGGSSALQITNTMKAAIDQLTRVVQKAESEIAKHVEDISNVVHGHTAYFVAARPTLATLAKRDLTGERGLGEADR
ncbi:MAG TPA: hypothetical protein VGR06_18040 [Actinophytocola sp.]|jgi:hypothetical protein|uniref:hypothetical protein n=1 Tax=Actinophytocola sp. TaxID=1872138 RepID=UPI002E04C240|nr:hypothetical protein [Actinophytocola sp.]